MKYLQFLPLKKPDFQKVSSEAKEFFNKPLALGLSALLLVSSASAYYFYDQYTNVQKDPQATAQKEVDNLIAEISQFMILPENELPTIATVADPARLAGQPFFARAKQGDKVLIYTSAKKAILYDPVARKILEVAPVNLGQPSPSTTPATR